MKKLLFFILLISCFKANAQLGSPNFLESKNGYKAIILGNDLSTINKEKLLYIDGNKKLDADSCLNIGITDSTLYTISDKTTLRGMAITTYKNRILKIILLFDKKDGYDILSILHNAFGMPLKPNQFMNFYMWESNKVELTMNFEKSTGSVIYTCSPLQAEIDKNRLKRTNKAASGL